MNCIFTCTVSETFIGLVGLYPGGGGGYSHMYAIWVCAAVKGMVFKQFSLG